MLQSLFYFVGWAIRRTFGRELRMEPEIYQRDVKGKSDEEVLIAAGQRLFSNETPYLQMAAQVRSTQSLVAALKKASEDSGAVSARLFWLTLALVGALSSRRSRPGGHI
jgi:hypothetical protein